MPAFQIQGQHGTIFIDCSGDFKVGDPCPDGYIDREEWAKVHLKAGLKQEECGMCMKWCFPHELSDQIKSMKAIEEFRIGRKKHFRPVELTWRICKKCAVDKSHRGV